MFKHFLPLVFESTLKQGTAYQHTHLPGPYVWLFVSINFTSSSYAGGYDHCLVFTNKEEVVQYI